MIDTSSICAIIVTYNIGKDIHRCFNSIKNQVNEIVIVDNGSSNETINELQNLEKINNVKIVYNSQNKGIAYALNQGVQYAISKSYEWVLTLDHDSEATSDMIDNMLKAYKSLPEDIKSKVMIVTPSYIERALSDGLPIRTDSQPLIRDIDSEKSSGSLIKFQLFNNIGLYKESLFIDYVDHEFCLRTRKQGYRIISVSNANLLHSSGSLKKGNFFGKKFVYSNYPPIRRYYITRNRILVWKRYFHYFQGWVMRDMVMSIKDMGKIIFYEQEKLTKIGMIWKGILDSCSTDIL